MIVIEWFFFFLYCTTTLIVYPNTFSIRTEIKIHHTARLYNNARVSWRYFVRCEHTRVFRRTHRGVTAIIRSVSIIKMIYSLYGTRCFGRFVKKNIDVYAKRKNENSKLYITIYEQARPPLPWRDHRQMYTINTDSLLFILIIYYLYTRNMFEYGRSWYLRFVRWSSSAFESASREII